MRQALFALCIIMLRAPAAAFGIKAVGRTVGRSLGLQRARMSSAVEARGKGRGTLYEDVTETIGNTPVVKISDKLCPPGVDMYVKCEFFNPLASVKDRLALAIIEEAEQSGTDRRVGRLPADGSGVRLRWRLSNT